MTATIHQLRPNARTHDRLRHQREQVRNHLIAKIGFEDVPLFDDNLLLKARFLAYATEAWNQAMGH